MINRKKTSPIVYIISTVVAIFITALAFEVFLQVVHLKSDSLKGTILERLTKYTDPPKSWERTFLTKYAYAEKGNIPLIAMEGLRGGNLGKNAPPEVQAVWDEATTKRSAAEWALRWI